jgi:single-strand DNA-binding protein
MNSITICGNMTRDPELRTTQSGKPLVNFGVADNRNKDKTLFFDCTAFDDVAQRILKYFKKGKPIFLSGTFDTREYVGRDGVQRLSLQVVVTSWDFVNVSRPENAAAGTPAPNRTTQPVNSMRGEEAPYADADAPPEFTDLPDITDPFADQ